MTINFVEVAAANFRTDEESDSVNTEFMKRLGFQKRYLPARLAISCSLGIPAEPEYIQNKEYGKVIKGDTLFGTDASLMLWVALLIQHSKDKEINLQKLLSLVGAHWRRGIISLNRDWETSGGNTEVFYKRLLNSVGITAMPEIKDVEIVDHESAGYTDTVQSVSVPVGEVGEDVSSGDKVLWNLNGKGGSPHCAIMGGVGTGKTSTATQIMKSIRDKVQIPLIAFDFKGDIGTSNSGDGYKMDQYFNASTLEPPRLPIPLDVFSLPNSEEASEIDVAEAASRFRESFARLKGSNLGDVQRSAIHRATTSALRKHKPCQLKDIMEQLSGYYEENGIKKDGAIATMEELCRFPLFAPEYSPKDFFQKSWIIRLPHNVPEDCRSIVVNLVLDSLDQHLNSLSDSTLDSNGTRSMRILCVVDEAHHVLNTKLPSLSNLVRMSRSKGGAIMLISQTPDDFTSEEDDFLAEMGLVVAFSTNAPPRQAQRVLGKGANLSTLEIGECYAKKRGDKKATKVRAWG